MTWSRELCALFCLRLCLYWDPMYRHRYPPVQHGWPTKFSMLDPRPSPLPVKVVEEYCGSCSGQGLVEKTKQVKVRRRGTASESKRRKGRRLARAHRSEQRLPYSNAPKPNAFVNGNRWKPPLGRPRLPNACRGRFPRFAFRCQRTGCWPLRRKSELESSPRGS